MAEQVISLIMDFISRLKQNRQIVIGVVVIIVAVAIFFIGLKIKNQTDPTASSVTQETISPYRSVSIEITPNATIGNILREQLASSTL